MGTQKISLTDRYDLEKSPVLLNGTQALVRMMCGPSTCEDTETTFPHRPYIHHLHELGGQSRVAFTHGNV